MPVHLPMHPDGFVVVDDDFAAALLKDWRRGWRIEAAGLDLPRPVLVIPNRKRWGIRARLARLVTQAPPHLFPQHINGDVLDCRRKNLRLVVSRGEAGSPVTNHSTSGVIPTRDTC